MGITESARRLMGRMLKGVKAGSGKLLEHQPRITTDVELVIRSDGFGPDDPLPREYSGEGANISPPLYWAGAPEGTKEFLLLMEDPDAPMPQPYVHWLVYHIPANCYSLQMEVPKELRPVVLCGAVQGKNSAGTIGYTGPMPPMGHGVHHYHFQLFALDAVLNLPSNPGRDELLQAMTGHVLAEGDLVGTYERK